VRHAEVDAAWRGRAYGDLDVPLSPDGIRATESLAQAFRGAALAGVYASPLERAARLGRCIAAATGAPLATKDGLREIFRGAWQGRPTDEIGAADPQGVEAYYADPWSFDAHGGESDAALLARVLPVLDEALRLPPGAAVVLATHYNVIRVLVAHLLGIPPARSFAFRVDPCHATLLEDRPEGWVLRCANTDRPSPDDLTPNPTIPVLD
jgi:broad specificity phosphatase PhoE